MPSDYVLREDLMIKITSKVCFTDPDQQNVIMTIIGTAGNGKTTLVTALCYQSLVKDKFTDHILFISLGPQATDPIVKLTHLYCDLTGQDFSRTSFDNVEIQIKEALENCSHNKLVIIDDVWHIDDAKPIINAFSNCHIVLCTRMNDIAQYIPTKHIVVVDEMKLHEAMSLLSSNFTKADCNAMSKEDRKSLEELAKDAHFWPLLLSLISGHLFHYCKVCHLCCHEAIQAIKYKLYKNGLTSFDIYNFGVCPQDRSKSVNACIKLTLELLSDDVLKKLYTLILFTGIGGSFPKLALHRLWSISEQEADEIAFLLWKHGLVLLKHIILPSYYKHCRDQKCIVTHSIISEYIINSIMIDEVTNYSPFILSHTEKNVHDELESLFKKSYGANDVSQLTPKDYLIYTLHKIEYAIIPVYVKSITMYTLHDPHLILAMLQRVQRAICKLVSNSTHYSKKIVELSHKCTMVLKNSQKSNRILNAKVERHLFQKNYDAMIQTIEKHYEMASIGQIALECSELVNNIIRQTENKSVQKSELVSEIFIVNEMFLLRTDKFHTITMEKMPIIKKYVSLHKMIYTALNSGTNICQLYTQIRSGDFQEELKFISQCYLIQLDEISLQH